MLGAFAASLAIAVASPHVRARTLQITDMRRIVDIQEPGFSPNGRWIAFVATRQDFKRAVYVNRLLLINTKTGAMRTLLDGAGVCVPRWSPDGNRIAYLARLSPSAVQQAYVRDLADARVTQLTHARGDVIDVAWSHDGRFAAFVAADVPHNEALLSEHHDYFFAGDNDYTASAVAPPDHLWIVSTRGGTARRITSGDWTIAPTDPGGIFSPQIAWTKDDRRIVFTRVENTMSGDSEFSTLREVDLVSGVERKVTDRKALELSPSFSPDGTRLVYWWAKNGDINSQNTLRLRSSGRDIDLTAGFDRNVGGSQWFPDGKRLLMCANDHTSANAWQIDLAGTVRRIDLGGLNIICDSYMSSTFDSGIDADISKGGAIAFAGDDATNARELYVIDKPGRKPRRLTHFNDWLQRIALGASTELDWKGPNGFREDGVVTYPPNMDRTKRYPILVMIHGGPWDASLREFAEGTFWPRAPLFAAHGYIVFEPNYRGSDNLGNAYTHAIYRDTSQGPGLDIMAGLSALEATPNADAARVAVSGWSYGGQLTSWLIGHVHTWKAAVTGAAVNDQTEEYDISTSNVQNRYTLGTSPWVGDGPKLYAEQSPITYYAQIDTPTLMWGTTLDPVVPIPQQYALFHALRDNHVPVTFVIFPAGTHGPSNPVQTADLSIFWLDWIDRYVKGAR